MTESTSPFSPSVRRFLEAPRRFAVVGTIGSDGAPQQAVAWFLVDDAGIHLNSLAGRRWPANLRRDPRVTVTVADGYDYVIVDGRAELVDEGERAAAEIRAMARRYGSDDSQYGGQHRLSFVVRPEHVAVHGEVEA